MTTAHEAAAAIKAALDAEPCQGDSAWRLVPTAAINAMRALLAEREQLLAAAQPTEAQEVVGEALEATQFGFTVAIFYAKDVPAGTKLYAAPVPVPPARQQEARDTLAERHRRLNALLAAQEARDEAYTLDQIADACIHAEVNDSKYESICIALAALTPPAPVTAEDSSEVRPLTDDELADCGLLSELSPDGPPAPGAQEQGR